MYLEFVLENANLWNNSSRLGVGPFLGMGHMDITTPRPFFHESVLGTLSKPDF